MSEIDDLFALLKGSAFAPFSAAAGDPNQIPQQGAIGDGNVQPAGWYSEHSYSLFIGQTNLLPGPTMEEINLSNETIPVGSTNYLSNNWEVRAALNSGTAPTTLLIYQLQGRVQEAQDNPFNSALVELWASGFGANACDIDLILTNGWGWSPNTIPTLAFLVGACRFLKPATYSGDAVVKAYVELVHSAGPTVVTSAAIDMNALAVEIQAQAVVSREMIATGDHYWRVRINIVKPASTTETIQVGIGEPLMHQAYTPDVGPYSPLVGQWVPQTLIAENGLPGGTCFIQMGGVDVGFAVDADGDVRIGGYLAGPIRFRRTAVREMTIDDNASGAVQVKLLGSRVAIPKATQTLVAATAIVADYEVVQISAASAITLTAAPTIADASDGQMLLLVNVGSYDITLQDQGTLTSSNLRLTAAGVTLGPRASIQLMYSSTVGDWVQIGNKVAVL